MEFKKWLNLQEIGTTTGSIAVFSRQVMPIVTRIWPTWGGSILNDEEEKPKPKHKKKNKKKSKKK
jgi:hypothetical protein